MKRVGYSLDTSNHLHLPPSAATRLSEVFRAALSGCVTRGSLPVIITASNARTNGETTYVGSGDVGGGAGLKNFGQTNTGKNKPTEDIHQKASLSRVSSSVWD